MPVTIKPSLMRHRQDVSIAYPRAGLPARLGLGSMGIKVTIPLVSSQASFDVASGLKPVHSP